MQPYICTYVYIYVYVYIFICLYAYMSMNVFDVKNCLYLSSVRLNVSGLATTCIFMHLFVDSLYSPVNSFFLLLFFCSFACSFVSFQYY